MKAQNSGFSRFLISLQQIRVPGAPEHRAPETNRAAQAAKRNSRISSKIVLKPGTGERQFGFSLGIHPLGKFETLDLV